MTPSSYLYDERDERHRLYLGEFCTIAGLRLFPDHAEVSHVIMHSDNQSQVLDSTAKTTTSALAATLAGDYIGLIDFSCIVERECKFSTHDDGECHFDATTEELVRTLVERATPPAYNDHLWETLKSNLGCYITINDEMQFTVHPDFDSLIESKNA